MATNNSYVQKTPQLVASLLSGITRNQGWRQQLDQHSLFLNWNQLVEKSISAHAQPIKIVGNVLWLEVANSAWIQHLQFQKIQLLENINAAIRLSHLEDIRFILDDNRKTQQHSKPSVRFVQPDPAALRTFEKQIAGIEDESIKDALLSLWYQAHACQRS
jgi:hypothetical protein